MSSLNPALAALAAQMSSSLLAMSQDGATETLAGDVESLSFLVHDLLLEVDDPGVPPTYTGWAQPRIGSIPDFPPPGLLEPS